MIANENIYYCKNCKTIKTELEQMLFVEESSTTYFCCESCIEKFYAPIISHYTGKISQIRNDLHILDDDAIFLMEEPGVVDKLLTAPDEIWKVTNKIGEQVFSYIKEFEKKGKKYYLLSVCFVFNSLPSFVLAITATSSEYLKQQFQFGEKIDVKAHLNQSGLPSSDDIDPEIVEQIELKKSTLLAFHLLHRKDADIPFEAYEMYSEFIEGTLDNPDETYMSEDDNGEDHITHIKAFDRDGISFFYIAICIRVSVDEESDLMIPVYSFPTIDGQLCDAYRTGLKTSGNLKN